MPLLKKAEKDTNGKPILEWVIIQTSQKKVMSNDVYVLGHADVKMPAVVSSSTIKGVKARLVRKKTGLKGPPSSKVDPNNTDILESWDFTKNNQTKPIIFSSPLSISTDFWVEMCNTSTTEDAVVNVLVHGLIRSKGM